MDAIIGETGIVEGLNHNSQTVFLEQNYNNPVIFAQPLSYQGSDAAIVRIEDIQSDRFTAFLQEPRNLDGTHTKESFSYLVVEEGTWRLDDDTLLEVGTVNTNLLTSDGWEDVDFSNSFTADPLVFSQVQTDNDSDFVRTRQRNTSLDGFQIAMEEEEAFNNSGHAQETVGWMAISEGSGSWSQNNYLAGTTGDNVTSDWHTIDFDNNFSRSPVFLSSIASYDGSDPSGLRYRNLSSNQIDIKIEEDTTGDRETTHTTEVVNFLTFAGNSPLQGVSLEENSNANEESEENWDIVYDGLNQNEPLIIRGMKNVLIKNSTFKNIKDSDAISIKDSDNVHIQNIMIDNVSGEANLDGIQILNSTNVTVEDSIITRIYSPGYSAGINITGGKSANITLENNHIYDTYANGILSGGCSACATTETVHDVPNPGLKITNNLIHDTGKTPTPIDSAPTHGMYVKATDAFISNNTVYNAFDGEGISIRSTAVVINNKVWDTKLAAVEFSQMKPAGALKKSVFENNELFYTENKPQGPGWEPLLFLNWNKKYPLRYENIVVRNNTLSICTEEVEDIPLIKLYPFKDLTIVDNDLIDHRTDLRFFSYTDTPLIRYEELETNNFNESSC